jgi:hypothetical protein
MSDDAEARRQRAARLRERIAEVTGKSAPGPESGQGPSATDQSGEGRSPPRVRPISPRTFVEERMRELDRDKDKKR